MYLVQELVLYIHMIQSFVLFAFVHPHVHSIYLHIRSNTIIEGYSCLYTLLHPKIYPLDLDLCFIINIMLHCIHTL